MSIGYATLVLIIYVLAVMRLVRLINGDKILDRLRVYPVGKMKTAVLQRREALATGQLSAAEAAEGRIERWDKVSYFIQCPWCVGMWLAFGTAWVPLWHHDHPVARYIAIALAASHLVGLFARFADTEEIEIEDADAE